MNEIENIVKVGIADMNTVKSPTLIRTSGLGSCVGVVLFEKYLGIAGMAHVMLPDSTLSRASQLNVAKYADTALKELVNQLVKQGASGTKIKAKIAGGAQMFQFSSGSNVMRIGPRNIEAVKRELTELNIPLLAEDCGGNNGRTIEFNPVTGMLTIRTVNKGTKEI
jgi:chemotaxis protein CheD